MNYEFAERLKALPPYLFAEIDKAKREAIKAGRDIIDLGVGDPDLPTPKHIIDNLYQAAKDPKNHRYALDQGMPEFRRAIANWYKKRFEVTLDADTEVLPLIGSKEGIAHMPLAFVNPGDCALIPDPCYPPYKSGTLFAGGKIELMPLLKENHFLPDIKSIKPEASKKYRLMYINYPNNPTSAVADEAFFKSVIEFASRNNIIVCHDAAYSEMSFDGYKAPSFLELDGAKEVGIEFHSLSKTYNMTGWRIGFAVGNKKLIEGLGKVKSNVDSGIFQAIQVAAISALEGPQDGFNAAMATYAERRDILVDGLKKLGFKLDKPKATFYVWAEPPKLAGPSIEMARAFLDKANIIVTPGVGFGKHGEGFIRMALTVRAERMKEALSRISDLKL